MAAIHKRIFVKYFIMVNIGLLAVLALNSCSKEKQLIKLLDGSWSATPSDPVDSSSTIIVLEYTFNECNDNDNCNGSYLFEIFGSDTTSAIIDFTWELNSRNRSRSY